LLPDFPHLISIFDNRQRYIYNSDTKIAGEKVDTCLSFS
jgi:hypothetical protein